MHLRRKATLRSLLSLLAVSCVSSFSICGGNKRLSQLSRSKLATRIIDYSTTNTQLLSSSSPDNSEGLLSNFNPLYGGLWLSFLIFAFALAPGTVGDPADSAMIQAYIDNPTAPAGMNPLFLIIFNGLGIMPLVISQLACPQGSKEGLPGGPFLGIAVAMGYFGAGVYLTLRAPPVERKSQQEASWFTRTVLENKITSVAAIGLLVSGVVTANGLVDQGWAATVSDFGSVLQQSKFVSASTLDLTILTIVAATLIPRDLQLRSDEDTTQLGRSIAIGTQLLPILGAGLYCLWRPSLPEE